MEFSIHRQIKALQIEILIESKESIKLKLSPNLIYYSVVSVG